MTTLVASSLKSFLLFFLIAIFVVGCAGKAYKVSSVIEQPNILLGYFDYQAEGQLTNFSHPAQLSAAELSLALSSLVFKEVKTLRNDKARKVFVDSEIKIMVPLLRQLLSKATANQTIYFALRRRSGEGVRLFSRVTSGQLFYRSNGLHLVFGEVQRELVEGGGFRVKGLNFGSLDKSFRKNWQLQENRLVQYAEVVGHPGKKHRAHLIVKLVADKEGKNLVEKKQKVVEQQSTKSAIEERLAKLKNLFEKGLINKEEFTAKKKEILNQL